jgi:nucleoid-associated protein YgaU
MARYTQTPVIKTDDNPTRRYTTTKYPEIPLDFSDIYVYITKGDRYDILANVYYGDSSLWWVISSANPTLSQDSLTPPPGAQVRIPSSSRLASILGVYESLNKNI